MQEDGARTFLSARRCITNRPAGTGGPECPVAQRRALSNRGGATFEFYRARAGDIIRV